MEERTWSDSRIAVIDSEEEAHLELQVSRFEQFARDMVISNDAAFASAGDLTREIKILQKKVEAYWEPIYRPAYTAYRSINEHKKAMIEPLRNAEAILKGKISCYLKEQEKRRREQEERMRRLALEEMERKLREAAVQDEAGDSLGAEFTMAEAEVLEGMALTASVMGNAPKAEGVSQSRTWRITEIDSALVPVSFSGVEIRPVDEKAILKLIRQHRGKISIPGVRFEEDYTVSVRT